MLEHAHSIISDAVEEQYPGAIGLRGANFPAMKKNSVGSAYVEGLAMRADRGKADVRLLHEVGREGANNGMKKGRGDEPSEDRGDKRRGENEDKNHTE